MRAAAAGFAILVALAVASCSWSSVPTTPLRGETPASVLVLVPQSMRVGPQADLRSLAFGADRALVARGYRALPLGAGFDLARRYGQVSGGETEEEALRRLHFQAGVDAVLHVEVADWEVSGERRFEHARWDLTWRLCSTKGGAEIWRHRLQGQWHRVDDPMTHATPVSEEPPPVEVGGSRAMSFASERDLVASLHRAAMERLPERER